MFTNYMNAEIISFNFQATLLSKNLVRTEKNWEVFY